MRTDARPVIVFRLMAAVPVWHLFAEPESEKAERADGRIVHLRHHSTLCGQTVWSASWSLDPRQPYSEATDYRSQERGTFIRRDHARKIGRQCDRCAKMEP